MPDTLEALISSALTSTTPSTAYLILQRALAQAWVESDNLFRDDWPSHLLQAIRDQTAAALRANSPYAPRRLRQSLLDMDLGL